MTETENKPWGQMTHEEKNVWLFREQKETLHRFLEHGAITKEQNNKSPHDLMRKMGTNQQNAVM